MRPTLPYADWPAGGTDRELARELKYLRAFSNVKGTAKSIVETADATPLTVWADVMPEQSIWTIEAEVMALSSVGDAGYYLRSQRYRRTTGAPVLVRSTTPIADDEDVPAWDITFATAADGTVSLAVTGSVGKIVDWVFLVEVMET